jgi:hypothetical protein
MISIFLSAVVLAALTVAVHATGIAFLLRSSLQPKGVWHVTRMLLRMIWWAGPAPFGGDIDLGLLLSVARMPAQCRNRVLLFRRYLHHPWLRRRGAGEAVAVARTDRELDGSPHVRLVDGLLLCHSEPRPSIAARERHRRFQHRMNRYSPEEN